MRPTAVRRLSIVIAVTAMLVTERASALSTDPDVDVQCSMAVTPAAGAQVPANAPALVVEDRPDGALSGSPRFEVSIDALRSTTSKSVVGLPIDTRRDPVSGGLLVQPKAALVVGDRYELAIERSCPDATKPEDRGPDTITSEFVAGPSMALPTVIGRAHAGVIDEDGDGEILLTLSPELAAYAAVALIDVEVNRTSIMSSHRYGLSPGAGGTMRFVVPRSACPAELHDGNVRPVPVLVRAHVAGVDLASDPEPLGLEAKIRCERDVPLPSRPPSAGPDAAVVDSGACGCRAAGGNQNDATLPTAFTSGMVAFAAFLRRRSISERARRR